MNLLTQPGLLFNPDPDPDPDMIGNPHGWTHEQIAEVMGISAARVKQIEKRALGKLRQALERRYHVTVEDVRDIIPPDSHTYDFWA